MGLALPGVFSGMDTEKIIQQLMEINRQPVARLGVMKSTWAARQKAVDEVEGLVGTLKAMVDGIRTEQDLRATSAASSDVGVLGVSASAMATEGAHSITIGQLARAEREVHEGVSALDEALDPAAGKLVYTYGIGDDAVTRTIQTTGNTTLEGLRDLINNDAGNPGVTASILEYEVDEDHVYHLVLSGADSGGDYTVTIDGGTTLAGFGAATFEETQSAQDAWLKVDGYPPGEGDWIARSTNSVTDVIQGVTLNLQKVGSANVTLVRDTSKLKIDLQNLVNIYNAILKKVTEYTGYDAEAKKGGVLQGDAALNGVLSAIRSAILGQAAGFVSGTDTYTLANLIGISVDKDGEMSLDTNMLDEALEEDYLGVLALIGADRSGTTDSNYIQFLNADDTTEPGVYEVQVNFDSDTGNIVSAFIRQQGETLWRTMDIDPATGVVTGEEGNPEEWLSLTTVWDGQVEEGGIRHQTATARVRQGFGGALYEALDDMTEATVGTFAIKDSHIEAQMSAIQANIDMKQTNLDATEKRLRKQYARLEATLAQFDSQRGAFEAMLNSLPTVTNTKK